MSRSPKIQKALARIRAAERKLDDAHTALDRLREDCPHENIKSWTNNDGSGQFTVNRCLDCGLQEDGPLPGRR